MHHAFSCIKKFSLSLSFLLLPFLVFAQATPTPPKNLTTFVMNFIDILIPVTLFVSGFGFFGMLTGILKYVGAGGDEERLGKAKQLILYGLLGMLIMFSFWGLARLLANTYLGVNTF